MDGEFNGAYGSTYEFQSNPAEIGVPFNEWIDDYDLTGSYVDLKVGDYMPESALS